MMSDPAIRDLRPTAEELNALPEKVQAYISALEQNLVSAEHRIHQDSDELRRKRFAYWNNSRR